MANLAAKQALGNIGLRAHASLMAAFVTLETELGVACERLMCVLPTQYAIQLASLIGALTGHVAEAMAVVALDGHVVIRVVASGLLLDFGELVCSLLIFRLLGWFSFSCLGSCRVWVLFKVHIALNGPSRDDHVRVPSIVLGTDVVGRVVALNLLHPTSWLRCRVRYDFLFLLTILTKEFCLIYLPHHKWLILCHLSVR